MLCPAVISAELSRIVPSRTFSKKIRTGGCDVVLRSSALEVPRSLARVDPRGDNGSSLARRVVCEDGEPGRVQFPIVPWILASVIIETAMKLPAILRFIGCGFSRPIGRVRCRSGTRSIPHPHRVSLRREEASRCTVWSIREPLSARLQYICSRPHDGHGPHNVSRRCAPWSYLSY